MNVWILRGETQADLGYTDTDILGVFASYDLAMAEARRREADDLLRGTRVEGREDEWPVTVGRTYYSDDWETSYAVGPSYTVIEGPAPEGREGRDCSVCRRPDCTTLHACE